MSDATNGGGLTDAEKAYFESGGETDLPENDEPAVLDAPEAGEPTGEDDSPAEGGEDGEKARQRTRMVPHQALHEAREALRAEREQRIAFEARINERLALLNQPQQPAQPDPEPPDAQTDPLGRLSYLESQLKKSGDELQAFQRQTRENQARSQVAAFAVQDEAKARTEVADFDDAKRHLLQSRGRELWAQSGGRATEHQIAQQLAAEEEQLRVQAISAGMRPSVAFYQMAQARGYTPKTATPAAEADDRLAAIAEGQQANKTLSGSGSAPGGSGPMTAERLAGLSDKEFQAWCAKNPGGFQRLAGG